MTREGKNDYDLVIVGTGICGLNALYSACKYLKKTSKVAIVDKHPKIGGMWTETYDYVRLHQPHGLFTIGSYKWKSKNPASYLANKEEILEHFETCYQKLKKKVQIVEFLEHEYVSHTESTNNVEVTIKRGADSPLVFSTKNLIRAFGFGVPTNQDPLQFSCSADKAKSILPRDIPSCLEEIKETRTPIYIVGGGKTGMDTAKFLLSNAPECDVYMLGGAGTHFMNRNVLFPSSKKFTSGMTINSIGRQFAWKFDGENIDEMILWVKDRCSNLALDEASRHSFLGILSPDEFNFIKNGIKEHIREYLDDVSFCENGNEKSKSTLKLKLRSGKELEGEVGSWFVNCTGHLLQEVKETEPYISPGGHVLSIQSSSQVFLFTSFEGFFLTHLLYRGKILSAPLYMMNQPKLYKQNKRLWYGAVLSQFIYNLLIIVESLPLKVILDCGLNFDKWYPLPRQGVVIVKLLVEKSRLKKHIKKALGKVEEQVHDDIGRFGPVVKKLA